MELGLSLGEAQKPLPLMHKAIKSSQGLGFCMDLGFGFNSTIVEAEKEADIEKEKEEREEEEEEEEEKRAPPDQPVQLDLLPLLPVNPHHPSFPWPAEHGNQEAGPSGRCFDANRMPLTVRLDDGAVDSTFRMELSICRSGIKRETEAAGIGLEMERSSSRASDEEENSLARKKLRLSKEQSAFLEECFKEHSTLNPKQKLALAKQLNLRPRQVEVWFQNRRARTKLKQTEVDCEYLKRCCETLTIENKRLQKELQELRALKASHSFYARLPPTTLTMCPSCERVVTSSLAGTDASGTAAKHRSYSVSRAHRQSAAST